MTPPPTPAAAGPVRVGIAGLGAVAQAVHLPLLARRPGIFRIAAVADLSPSLRDSLGDRYSVSPEDRVASVERLIERPGLDAILLLTSGSHGEPALAALDAGLAVLCEKPLAATLAEADALLASPNANRLLLGYMKTWDPAVREARRVVAEEAATLGDLRSIDVHVLHPTSEAQLAFAHLEPPATDVDPATVAELRATTDRAVAAAVGPDAGEGGRLYWSILQGSLVHELSVIRAVTGDAEPLTIDHADAWPNAWPPSVGVVGRLSSGVRVSLGWHDLDRYPAYREEVRLHFEGGSVELTFPAPYRLNQPTILRVDTGGSETRRRVVFESIEEAFESELLSFARLVRDGEPPPTGIAHGRTDTITCLRIASALAERRGLTLGGEAATAGR